MGRSKQERKRIEEEEIRGRARGFNASQLTALDPYYSYVLKPVAMLRAAIARGNALFKAVTGQSRQAMASGQSEAEASDFETGSDQDNHYEIFNIFS